MNKENNRGAAGLRRSAIAERIRLREEWSALKEVDESGPSRNIVKKKPVNSRSKPTASNKKKTGMTNNNQNNQPKLVTSEALTGVVALVEVGSETRALPLRAALTALGATIVTSWSPLITHLIWTDGGSRALRARARVLACKVVSPLWVEACAASNTKLRESMFPVASRQSDLPSPRTLRVLLKKAENENIPLVDLLSDSKDDKEMPQLRLRISCSTDTSREITTDISNDSIGVESRINTAPRRGGTTEKSNRLPVTTEPSKPPPKSKRKLFTHREAQDLSSDDNSDTTKINKSHQSKLTQSERKDLARAEKLAKKLLAASDTQRNNNNNVTKKQNGVKPRIVLTGMSRAERSMITKCVQQFGGIIQNGVNKRTTHVILGSCSNNVQCDNNAFDITGVTSHLSSSYRAPPRAARTVSALCGAARGARVLQGEWAVDSATEGRVLHHHGYEVMHLKKIAQVLTGMSRAERSMITKCVQQFGGIIQNGVNKRTTHVILGSCSNNVQCDNNAFDITGVTSHLSSSHCAAPPRAARTVSALCGAARGARVLQGEWAVDSATEGRVLHHHGYEVMHLKKIAQKARVERSALGLLNSEYAYDVFNGIQVRVSADADNRDSAIELLKLCGAVVQDGGQMVTQDGGQVVLQNGRRIDDQSDIVIGNSVGEVNSKWVFDSIAAARMRTTRRYISMNSSAQLDAENR